MPKFRNSEHYYGNGINVAVGTGRVAPGLKTTKQPTQHLLGYVSFSVEYARQIRCHGIKGLTSIIL